MCRFDLPNPFNELLGSVVKLKHSPGRNQI
jgi:hypothetical protein